MSYSQNNEESFVLAATAGIQNGRVLDIGAWHFEDKSNSRALILNGWSGVLIEPSPGPFAGLVEAYRDVARVTVLNAAIGFEAGEIEMWVTDDAVSTSDQATYEKWKGHAAYRGQIKVQSMLLEDIFLEHADFDFVSIDAEGISVDLMHRLLELGKRPRCICVEHDERTTEVLSAATALGYACVYASAENLVLVK